MRQTSDEALMQAYGNGDMAAFERLYQRHRGPLYRYVLRLAGEAATANDLYQGTWEKVIAARQKYRPEAPFAAWLYRIAHNHAMDFFRRSRPTVELTPDSMQDGNPGPEAVAQDAARRSELERAVQRLPTEQKEVLLLRLEAGLDLDAIAQVTGVGRETAKSRLRYAVGKLRRVLADPAGGTTS